MKHFERIEGKWQIEFRCFCDNEFCEGEVRLAGQYGFGEV
jgi:hypothetical protein